MTSAPDPSSDLLRSRPGLLQGSVGIVAGVGRGLGRDVALAFAREGADVVLAARSVDVPAEIAAEVEALGQNALCVQMDMRDAAGAESLAAAAVERFGRVDTLVTVAYLTTDRTTLVETDSALEAWRRQFDVNLFGALSVARAVAPQMIRQGHGRIIFINTMATRLPAERMAPYIGSKTALAAMARVLALELGPHGIRVNSVHPGYIWGERIRQIFERRARDNGTTYDEEYEKVRSGLALGYIPSSEEYAGTVVFLASALSAPITGESIYVNAGQTRH
jgi:NAD(P)-dependent dehydrogenase (short-subunit alcohol dehydrogenase family)